MKMTKFPRAARKHRRILCGRDGGIRGRRSCRGFSLLELLTVMVLISILATVGAGLFVGGPRSIEIATAADALQAKLSYARQMAMAHNQYVQVRFYRPPGAASGYSYLGLFAADSPRYGAAADYQAWKTQGAFRPLEPLYRFTSSVSVMTSPAASKLLSSIAAKAGHSGQETIGGAACDWVGFYFRPDGSTDLASGAAPLQFPDDCFLTLADARKAGETTLPANFATLVISPVNGQVLVRRP